MTVAFASIGDCVVDIYPDDGQIFLGGTAFNAAIAAHNAGANVSIVSAVGDDAYGTRYLAALRQFDIDTTFVRQLEGETSSVEIHLDEFKSPHFSEWKIGVLESLRFSQTDVEFLHTQQIVRAIMLKPLHQLVVDFAALALPDVIKVGDLDGLTPYTYDLSEILPFIDGLDIVIKSVEHNNRAGVEFLKNIAQDRNKLVLVLKGKQGSTVFTREQTFEQAAHSVQVVDTTGAGDAYIGTFCVTYARTRDVGQAMKAATEAATQAVTHIGAVILE